jgi:hypothetical protein
MDLFCKKVVGNGNKFGRICVVADQLSELGPELVEGPS